VDAPREEVEPDRERHRRVDQRSLREVQQVAASPENRHRENRLGERVPLGRVALVEYLLGLAHPGRVRGTEIPDVRAESDDETAERRQQETGEGRGVGLALDYRDRRLEAEQVDARDDERTAEHRAPDRGETSRHG
jgi:hypothetical protein